MLDMTDAWYAGALAYMGRQGQRRQRNPFPEGSFGWIEWGMGRIAAKHAEQREQVANRAGKVVVNNTPTPPDGS